MSHELLSVIKKFTAEQSGKEVINISENTFLEEDLGIYGDDAVEYIIAFGKAFNVNVSNFMAADYFSSEGGFILPIVTNLFTRKKENKKKKLAIAHLIRAIKTGRLDEEVING